VLQRHAWECACLLAAAAGGSGAFGGPSDACTKRQCGSARQRRGCRFVAPFLQVQTGLQWDRLVSLAVQAFTAPWLALLMRTLYAQALSLYGVELKP